jgi:hypothetical protein
MRWPVRIVVVICGFACVLLAVYNAVEPGRNYLSIAQRISDTPRVTIAVSGGPGEAAGLHSGDVLDVSRTTFARRVEIFAAAPLGTTVSVPVVRDGRAFDVAVPITETPASSSRFFDLALVVIQVFFGILVMLRAGAMPLARMVVWLAVFQELGTVGADFLTVAPSTVPALAIFLAQFLFQAGTTMVALMAVALLPAGMPKVRRALYVLAPVLGLLSTLDPLLFGSLVSVVWPWFPTAGMYSLNVLMVATDFALMVLVVSIAQSASREHRARSMWFVSTIAFCWLFGLGMSTAMELWFGGGGPAAIIYYFLLSCTLIGPIYATLRHRIVDLNVIVSRSTVFAILSIFLVAAFAGAEWLAGKVADSFIREGIWQGIFTQMISLGVALITGIYLRRFHARVEARVNGILFRERNRRLSLLESFAREADLLQTRSELTQATFEALRESLETEHIVVYVDVGGTLVRAHGSAEAPERLDRDNRIVLQLNERHRPFVSEVATLRGWMLVPLSVRREIVGAIACGQKRDRTEYLPDEKRALLDIAAHVGTSYALLPPVLGGHQAPVSPL